MFTLGPEFETEVIAKKSKSPIAKQIVKKKRNRKKINSKKQLKFQDEDRESYEQIYDDSQYQAADDNILRVDMSAGFVSSHSSSESEFSDPESGYRHKIRHE